MDKGFTLMELLGVIVILSLLMIILIPNVLEQINNKKDDVTSAQEETIYAAADLYISNHPNDYAEGDNKCICLSDLQKSGFLSESLTNEITGETNYSGVSVIIGANGNNEMSLSNCC